MSKEACVERTIWQLNPFCWSLSLSPNSNTFFNCWTFAPFQFCKSDNLKYLIALLRILPYPKLLKQYDDPYILVIMTHFFFTNMNRTKRAIVEPYLLCVTCKTIYATAFRKTALAGGHLMAFWLFTISNCVPNTFMSYDIVYIPECSEVLLNS